MGATEATMAAALRAGRSVDAAVVRGANPTFGGYTPYPPLKYVKSLKQTS